MIADLDEATASEIEGVVNRLNTILGTTCDSELARRLDIPASTVSSWKTRVRMPHKVCLYVSKEYGVSLDWLYTGDGPMFTKLHPEGDKTIGLLNVMLMHLVQIENKLDKMRNKNIEVAQRA